MSPLTILLAWLLLSCLLSPAIGGFIAAGQA
jgi:hypothetical protein